MAPEGEGDFCDGIDVREDIGDDVHLGYTLELDFAPVLAPLFVCEMAVDGAVHVSWRGSIMLELCIQTAAEDLSRFLFV